MPLIPQDTDPRQHAYVAFEINCPGRAVGGSAPGSRGRTTGGAARLDTGPNVLFRIWLAEVFKPWIGEEIFSVLLGSGANGRLPFAVGKVPAPSGAMASGRAGSAPGAPPRGITGRLPFAVGKEPAPSGAMARGRAGCAPGAAATEMRGAA